MSQYEFWTLWYFQRHPFDLEELVARVLQAEHPDLVVELRGGSSGHGDAGRDAVIKARRSDPEPIGVIQVSARKDWREKFHRELRSFVKRIVNSNVEPPEVWIFASVQDVHLKKSWPHLRTATDKDDELRWGRNALDKAGLPTTRVEIWGLQDIVDVVSDPAKGSGVRVEFGFPMQPDDSLNETLAALDTFTRASLRGVSNQIEGLGSLARPEEAFVAEALESKGKALLAGDGGSGKSALLAHTARTARNRGSAVLFVRATMFSPDDDVTALERGLAIESNLVTSLRNVARTLPCLLVVDQLDFVFNSRLGTSLLRLIATVAEIEGVSVLIGSRTWQAERDPELGRLGLPRIVSKPLDCRSACRHLRSLGLQAPNKILIDLSTNLLNLSLIAELIGRGEDVSSVSGKVDLWHLYRKSLEDREGSPSVEYAVGLSRSTLSEDRREFAIAPPDQVSGDRLISRGALVPSRGETFRFRHQEIQEYLYSWDAALRRQLSAEAVKNEIGERLSRGPLAWILRMYLLEMPDLAIQLLRDVLLKSDWPFYTKADLLDVVLGIEQPGSDSRECHRRRPIGGSACGLLLSTVNTARLASTLWRTEQSSHRHHNCGACQKGHSWWPGRRVITLPESRHTGPRRLRTSAVAFGRTIRLCSATWLRLPSR